MAFLFTSNYCPACERRDAENPAAVATAPVARDSLYVGDDGELWWHRKDGEKLKNTYPNG
jgi:hypothetical protein